MADINERLDRLQRRQEFDRFGRPLRAAPAELPVGPVVARPAGVDDRLGEVLDAVAAVVRRHPGLSVMVALADGRAGRPVIRVTERDGGVETGVVVVRSSPARGGEPTLAPEPLAGDHGPAGYGPYDGMSAPAAAPARGSVPGSDPVFEPALRDRLPARDTVQAGRAPAGIAPANGRHAADRRAARHDRPATLDEPRDDRHLDQPRDDRRPDDRRPDDRRPDDRRLDDRRLDDRRLDDRRLDDRRPDDRRPDDRRPDDRRPDDRRPDDRRPDDRPHDELRDGQPRDGQSGAGWSGSSWHNALWSPESRGRFRPAEPDHPQDRADRGSGPTIPLPEDTSQVVSRLAQLLRENPTLAANWSREAPE